MLEKEQVLTIIVIRIVIKARGVYNGPPSYTIGDFFFNREKNKVERIKTLFFHGDSK